MTDAPQQLSVQLTSSAEGGRMYLAVYDSQEAFANDTGLVIANVPLDGNWAELDVKLPGSGKYVFAAFQDLNGNGRLDRNLLGVPTEPYGFTETPPTKWRAPTFDEVATEVEGDMKHVSIELKYWGEY